MSNISGIYNAIIGSSVYIHPNVANIGGQL